MARQDGWHVEFREAAAPIVDVAGRDGLDAPEHLSGLLAAMGLHHRGHQVGAALQAPVCLAEHRVRFADSGSCAEVDAQLPAFGPVVSGTHVNHHPSHGANS